MSLSSDNDNDSINRHINKPINSYVYGDSLGRITGQGRFNNVNSILVNAKRIFYKDENELANLRNIKQFKAQMQNNREFLKYNQKNKISTDNKIILNNSVLPENYLKNTVFNNQLKISLPMSFSSLNNNYAPVNKNTQNNSNNNNSYLSNNKTKSIENIFYNYNGKVNYNFNSTPFNSSNNSRSYSNNEIKNSESSNLSLMTNLSTFKPNCTNQSQSYASSYLENFEENFNFKNLISADNFHKNTSKEFKPNLTRDFHNIYQNLDNTILKKYHDNSPLISLSPNILINSINDPLSTAFKDGEKTNLAFENTFNKDMKIIDENYYKKFNCLSVKEYTVKKYHDKFNNESLNLFTFAIDKFNFSNQNGLFGLFQGLNGIEIAQYCCERLPNMLLKLLGGNSKKIYPYHPPNTKLDKDFHGAKTSIETILLNLFLKLDEDLKTTSCLNVGCTCCLLFLTKEEEDITGFNEKQKVLYCVNLGDIECCVVSVSRLIKITEMHNIDNKKEAQRIINNGGVIYDSKLYGQTELTRGIGLLNLRPYGFTDIPFINKIYLSELDKYIIIGNKPIFDKLSEADIIHFCNSTDNTEFIAENIFTNVINRNITDNLGTIIIKIK